MDVRMISRLLLQAEEPSDMPPAPEQPMQEPQNTQDVRIIGIFAIVVAGLVGGLLPIVVKCLRNPAHPATLLLRALAAGVMLALALIHVIPDGAADLSEVSEYPIAPCCVVFAVLVMVFMENMSRIFLFDLHANDLSMPHSHCGTSVVQVTAAPSPCGTSAPHTHEDSHNKSILSGPEGSSKQHLEDAEAANEDSHSHTCLAVNNAANWAVNPQGITVQRQIMAYMFELACVVHSVLIGIALGVTVDNRSQAMALMVALVFHQGLEGVGLGSTVIRASFSISKSVIMVSTYAIVAPLGVAIGMAIADSYDAESLTALTVQGVLNSVSGGLLLYLSLVQLIAEDFTRAELQQQKGYLFNLAMHGALAFGAACMAVIAIWN